MDYEKAYKDALERARGHHGVAINYGKTEEIQELEHIFPELRESEDERIRKFLKDYAIEMIAGLESDISISVYDGVKGHDPEAEAELEKWKGARAWLEKQKEQKPSEWSEEDERHINTIIRAIHGAGNITPIDGELAEKWLKSLRPQPHWKPSEEQMKAIDYVAENFDGPSDLFDNLMDLYQDLKKQM